MGRLSRFRKISFLGFEIPLQYGGGTRLLSASPSTRSPAPVLAKDGFALGRYFPTSLRLICSSLSFSVSPLGEPMVARSQKFQCCLCELDVVLFSCRHRLAWIVLKHHRQGNPDVRRRENC